MEAAKPNPRGIGERRGCGRSSLHHRFRSSLSGAGAPAVHWTKGIAGMRSGWFAGRRTFCTADGIGVRGGRRVSEVEDALDVVACDRRVGNWNWRIDLSAGLGRWLRHDWCALTRKRDDEGDFGSA